MDDPKTNDTGETAVSVHDIILGSSKLVRIQLDYDPEILTLQKVDSVQNLDDLCFCFTRLSTHQGYNTHIPIHFKAEIEDVQLSCYDHNATEVRLRIGSFIAHQLGESSILFHGNGPSMDADHTVVLHVENHDRIAHAEDIVQEFSKNCSTRGIKTIEPVERHTFIATEVAALFSEYFDALFYKNYKENGMQWIQIPDADPDLITLSIVDCVMHTLEEFDEKNMDWKFCAELMTSCDRFLFNKLFEEYRKKIRGIVSKMKGIDDTIISDIQTIARISRDPKILIDLVAKFLFLEPLEDWEERNIYSISSTFGAIIKQRKDEIRELSNTRTKLVLQYENGEIVCELLSDVFPGIVEIITEGLDNRPLSAGLIHIPDRRLPAIRVGNRPINIRRNRSLSVMIESKQQKRQKRRYPVYFFQGIIASVRICDQYCKEEHMAGLVTEGAHLVKGDRGAFKQIIIRHPVDLI